MYLRQYFSLIQCNYRNLPHAFQKQIFIWPYYFVYGYFQGWVADMYIHSLIYFLTWLITAYINHARHYDYFYYQILSFRCLSEMEIRLPAQVFVLYLRHNRDVIFIYIKHLPKCIWPDILTNGTKQNTFYIHRRQRNAQPCHCPEEQRFCGEWL